MISAGLGLGATPADCRGVLTIVWACAAIAVAVLTTMIYSFIAFHKSGSDGAATGMRGKSAQILWSLIPIGIFLGIAVPAVTKLLFADDHCGM